MIRKILTLELLFLCVLSNGCSFGERDLCEGYKLVRMSSQEFRIYHPKQDHLNLSKAVVKRQPGCIIGNFNPKVEYRGTMVSGNIESYAVKSPDITGYASGRNMDLAFDFACQGYFLIDTKTHDRLEGLSLEEWRTELNRRGWENADLTKLQ